MLQTTPEQIKPKVEPRIARVTPPKQPDQSATLKVPVKLTERQVAQITPPKPSTQNQARPKVEEKVEVTENGSRRFRCGICDIGFRFQVGFFKF